MRPARRPRFLAALAALAVAGCITAPQPPVAVVEPERPAETGWKAIATPTDRAGLDRLNATWAVARGAVRRRAAAAMAQEGPLVEPGAALDLPAIPPGPYRCRLVRLGGRKGFATFAPDTCYVDGNSRGVSLTKQTGENLPGGWLYPDTDRRQVFLGTFRQLAAAPAPAYGIVPARDIAGVVERVGPLRWRLVLTRAGHGALLDIYELVPVAPTSPTP